MAGGHTDGSKPMTIQGRMALERERLSGMTEEERSWRKKWLKDQILSPNEPRHVPELYKARYNVIRRAYRLPLDMIFRPLVPALGERAVAARWWTGKVLLTLFSIYSTVYYFKYNTNDWTRKGGWGVTKSRTAIFPGDPTWPNYEERSKPSDYGHRGFKNSPI